MDKDLTEQARTAFDSVVAGLPPPMQATIRDSMKRSESNSWSFFLAGWTQAAATVAEECAEVAEAQGDTIPASQADESWKAGIADAAGAIRAKFCEKP